MKKILIPFFAAVLVLAGCEKKAPVETALNELKEALKGSDVAAIKAKEEALMKAMEPIAQEMYAQQGAAAGAQGAPDPSAGVGTPPPQDNGAKNANDDVVDADYTMK